MELKRLALLVVATASLAACQRGQDSTPNDSTSAISQEKVVSFDAMDFSYALFAGKDTNEKTKEQYLLDMDGAKRIKLTGAFVYGKDTSGSPWLLLIGDNTPRIICEQESKEAKSVVAGLTEKLSQATVNGDYKTFEGNKLYLTNCTIESVSAQAKSTDDVGPAE